MESPVFLVGAPRSGTSLLYKALCLHPDVAYISNWVNRFPSMPQLAWANRLAARLPAAQRRVWFGGGDAAYVYGRTRPAWSAPFPCRSRASRSTAAAGVPEAVDGAVPSAASRTEALGAHVRPAAEVGRRPRRRQQAHRQQPPHPPAGRRLPRGAVRGARARWPGRGRVAASRRLVAREPALVARRHDGGGRRRGRCRPWELCAEAWVEEAAATRAGLASVAPDRVLSTTYEQFVGAPDHVLDDVARFAGLDTTDGWRRRRAFVRFPDRNQAWRSELPPAAVATIERVEAAALAAHGYA